MIVRVYFLSVQVTRILADSVNWRRNWYIVKFTTTRMGFEPTRAEHNGLAVHRLNNSATSSFSERSLSPESQTVPVLKTVVTMVTSGCGHKKKKKNYCWKNRILTHACRPQWVIISLLGNNLGDYRTLVLYLRT